MLKPVRQPHNNLMLGAPADWDESKGDCIGLPATRGEDGVIHSYWQPSETDIANILAGMPIRLSVFSAVHPPVAINVTDQAQG